MNEIVNRMIEAAIEIHKALRPRLRESAYQESVCRELALRNITSSDNGLRRPCGFWALHTIRELSCDPVRFPRYGSGVLGDIVGKFFCEHGQEHVHHKRIELGALVAGQLIDGFGA